MGHADTTRRTVLRGLASVPLASALALPAASRRAAAEAAWPDRPIRLIVPFAPGGVTDNLARLSAEWLSNRLGQSVVVENRSGANGAIAAEFVARSKPDGYTLLAASASQMVMLPALMHLAFDTEKDFAPISIVGSNPMVLGASGKLGVRTLPEFVNLAKRERGKLDYSSAGSGSSTHLAMALFLERAGIEMQHIPYRGGAPAVQALLAGDVAAYFGNPSDMIPYATSDTIRILAVAGPERLAALRDVPTVAEQGYPGFRAETWNGITAPAGTPDDIIMRLAAELHSACADSIFRASVERLGTTPLCSTPQEFERTMKTDAPLWREAVRISGAALE